MKQFSRWRCVSPGVLALALIVLQAGCLLIPDDKEQGTQVGNLRPVIRITGGAATPDPAGVDYKVQFYWSGSDVDGVISLYQWAVDDTITENAWHDTTGYTARFRFGATTRMGSGTTTFADWHTFYVRAIDNEFAFSKPDHRFFNARTIAPTSRITFPRVANDATPSLQRTMVMRWDGEDLDSSRPDKKPVFYEYKLCHLGAYPSVESSYVDSLRRGVNLLDSLGIGDRSKWIRVPATIREVTLRDLPADVPYAFGVRAIDEAGAVEPELALNRNYLAFMVTPGFSQPLVTITESSVGTHQFPGDGDIWEVSVPANRGLRFTWVGDATSYGSEAGNVNYALDIPDPDDETLRNPAGVGGWVGWGKWKGNQRPITFTAEEAGTTHYLYVYMRDVSDNRNSTQRCVIKMKVVAFTFSKSTLIVDDARFQTGVSDAVHDAFLKRSLLKRLYQPGLQVDEFPIWPGWGEGGSSPQVVKLEKIAEYQNVCWSLNIGAEISNGLKLEENEAVLVSFLNAGGRLFMFGGRIAGMEKGTLNYPFDPPTEPKEQAKIYYKFLYMQNEIVSATDKYGSDCYPVKSGLYVARATNPAYPDIPLDEVKWNPWVVPEGERDYRGGQGVWEGDMVGRNQVPAVWEGLDTLYVAETWNRSVRTLCGDWASPVQGAVISARYQSTPVDTLLGRQHGRVLYMNFQPWYWQEDRILDAGTAAINWLFTGRDQ